MTPDIHALSQFAGGMLANPEARSRMGERARTAINVPATLPCHTAQTLLSLMRRTPPLDDGPDVT